MCCGRGSGIALCLCGGAHNERLRRWCVLGLLLLGLLRLLLGLLLHARLHKERGTGSAWLLVRGNKHGLVLRGWVCGGNKSLSQRWHTRLFGHFLTLFLFVAHKEFLWREIAET